jgi:hypothetical protein
MVGPVPVSLWASVSMPTCGCPKHDPLTGQTMFGRLVSMLPDGFLHTWPLHVAQNIFHFLMGIWLSQNE